MKAAAACVAVVVGLWSPGVRAEAPPRNLDELRARVARVLLREQVPGAGIALVEGEHVLWAGGVGYADRERRVPVTADTLFRVASITKSFVALTLVKLAEQGRVELRARVSELAPELAIENRWAADAPITVAHLLEHTAGFDDMHPNEWYAPLASESMPIATALARNPASRVARWRPGSRFSYANPGYTVAGYVIEKVTGRTYEEAMRREVLEPLGMAGAALRWTPEVDARLARGYDDAGLVPYRANYQRPAGNLMASPRELAALVVMALGRGRIGGTTVVSPAGMARIERGETAALDLGDANYGLGNYGDVSERAVIRGHDGGIDGFLSTYGYLPEHGVGFVALINSTRSFRALIEIRHLVVEFLLAGASLRPPPRAVVPEDELRRWVGTYHGAAPRHQLFAFVERWLPGIELTVDRGRLYAQTVPGNGERTELIPLGGDRFRFPDASGGNVTFGRDREGRRVFAAQINYFVEEPRARSLAFAVVPPLCLWLFATGFAFPLARLRRQVGPSPGFMWPLCVSVSVFAAPKLFFAALAARTLGGFNAYTLGICALTLLFAFASAACAVEAIAWLPRPGSIIGKLHRMLFALAACGTTAYLAAYGIIGIRFWSY